MGSLIVACVAFGLVAVLPGFGVTAVWQRVVTWARGTGRREPDGLSSSAGLLPLFQGLGVSLLLIASVGGVMLGTRTYSTTALTAVVALMALLGVPAFVSWIRRVQLPWLPLATIALLSLPVCWSALRSGLAPTHSYQWFYWTLGSQLDTAGGIPQWVSEYGMHVRWHPDYVDGVLLVNAYRGLTSFFHADVAITDLRVPIALTSMGALYAVIRLWTGRAAALIGLASVTATTYYLIKFNAYKPEALAVPFGLTGVWLLVFSLRTRRWSLMPLAGLVIGATAAIHGIAAAVLGVFAAAAVLGELLASRDRPGMRHAMRALAVAVVCCAVVLVGTGLALQGRAVVASDAAKPALSNGVDPTWEFLERDNGIFTDPAPPPISDQLDATVTRLWPGSIVEDGGWIAIALVLVGGSLLAVGFGNERLRGGALALLGTLAIALLAMLYFSAAYDTFIPQHTGLARVGAYLGLLGGIAVAFVVELASGVWSRRIREPISRLAYLGVGAFVVALSITTGMIELGKAHGIGPTDRAALSHLSSAPSGAVLSNVSTRGLIEFETGHEVPLEGRQPVIENPGFLSGANNLLRQVQTFFVFPSAQQGESLLRSLGVRWLVVSDRSPALGSPTHFGPTEDESAALTSLPYLHSVWSDGGLTIFENGDPELSNADSVGPGKTRSPAAAIALLVAACSGLIGFRILRGTGGRTG